MIRQDYIVRTVEQFGRMLARIAGLVATGRLDDAQALAKEAVGELVGGDPEALLLLSHGGLMARLMEGGPTAGVRTRCYILAALLKRMGETHGEKDAGDLSYLCFLKALHLLLEVGPATGEDVAPEYTPKVEEVVQLLSGYELPPATGVLLMQHYERWGEYGKAEDRLHELPGLREGGATAELGRAFYRRLLGKSDEELEAGNLPRSEVEAGLKELESRLKTS